MDEPVLNKLKIALLLSKLNPAMSEAEAIESCKIYFKISSSKTINHLLILTLEELSEQQVSEQTKNKLKPKNDSKEKLILWLSRLALTKEAFLIIGSLGNSPNVNISPPTNKDATFKISTRNACSSQGTEHEPQNDELKKQQKFMFANLLAEAGYHNAKMNNPDYEFTIIRIIHQPLLCEKIWESTDKFELRKAHLRPVLHPTAINPRLSRAMINLAGASREVLDPFCGAGGTLIEAARINLTAIGTDISKEMIIRAERNVAVETPEVRMQITLLQADAFTWKKKVECIIADLPYGKSSKLGSPLSTLFEQFLTHFGPLTSKAVVCLPKGTTLNINSPWSIKYSFDVYIHKSLTRNILVLENK